MKFFACIKQVPDLTAPFQLKDGDLQLDSDRMMLNAYDASAVEEALVLTEKHEGELEVVLIGPEKARETIRKALAMGAVSGHHILVDNTEGLDSAAYATILAAFFRDKTYDVIAVGKQSQDTDAGLTGGMLAEKLDIPFASNAVGLELEDDKLVVKRQGDTAQELIALPSPCLVTCSNDMNEPRIPSLKGIMQSKRKSVETKSLEDIGLSLEEITSKEVKTKVTGYAPVPERKPGKKFEGDPEELVSQLSDLLQNEAKVL